MSTYVCVCVCMYIYITHIYVFINYFFLFLELILMAIYQFRPFSFAPTALTTLNCNTCHIRYTHFIPLVVMELLSLSGITPETLHRDLTQILLDETESFRTHQRVHQDTTGFLQGQLHLTKRQHNGLA